MNSCSLKSRSLQTPEINKQTNKYKTKREKKGERERRRQVDPFVHPMSSIFYTTRAPGPGASELKGEIPTSIVLDQ